MGTFVKAVLALIIVLAACGGSMCQAQSVWIMPDERPSVSLEILKIDSYYDLYFGAGIKFYSTAWFLSGRIPVSDLATVMMEMPFVIYGRKEEDGYWGWSEEISETMVGNPYVGVELHDINRSKYLQLGVRLPLAPSDKHYAAEYGISTDFTNRIDAFASDVVTIRLRPGIRAEVAPRTMIHGYLGPKLYLPTEEGNDSELFFDYGCQLWVSTDHVRLGAGLDGLWMATVDDGNFAEKTLHQFGIGAEFIKGSIHPGLQIRVPLDDSWGPFLNYFYGINLTYVIGDQ